MKAVALTIVPAEVKPAKIWPVTPVIPKLDPDALTKEQGQALIRKYVGRHGLFVWHTTGRIRFWYGFQAFIRSLWKTE
jgi:hypothetical protein